MSYIKCIKLTDAAQELRVAYHTLYLAVVSGTVPAMRSRTGGRWLIDTKDLPAIKEALAGTAAQEVAHD